MNLFCSKDCPDLCGFTAEHNNGKFKFNGIAEEWSQNGFVCSKFKVFAEREINNGIQSYSITNGEKTEYSDAEAIESLATLLDEYKDKKILYMRGSGSLAYNMVYWDVLFSSFPNCYSVSGGPCDDTGGDAHNADFGVTVNPPVTNLEDANTIILYGKNAAVCSQHLYSYLKELKKKGKHIIYLDPVRTKTAELADVYIQIKPCYDGVLACAVLSELGLEEGFDADELLATTGVSRKDFDHIVKCIKDGKCAHIEGFGIQRHTNGMNAYQWLNRLGTKTGAEDMLYHGQSSKRQWEKQPVEFKDYVHVDKIPEVLANGDFDLYVNIAANPAMTYPDTNLWVKGLTKTKTVVVDTNHTETSANADFFLKVGGMFAQADFMGSYFFPHSYERDALVEAMSDTDAAKMLGDKLGIEINIKAKSDVKPKPEVKRKYQTEKLSLTMPVQGDGYQLITSSHHAYLNSQTLPGMEKGLQVIYINTKDAQKIDVTDGDDVLVGDHKGCFIAEVVVTDDIIENSVMCWKNIPMKEGYTNCAITNKLTDSGNGLVYYTHFVDINKI